MEISAFQHHVKAADIPFEKLASNTSVSNQDKVKEACRQFEAVLLRQMLTEARKTVIQSGGKQDSNETGIYNDMVNNQLADSISRSGEFGLAKSLENQLVHQVLPNAPPASQPEQAVAAAPQKELKHN